mmetsp:Transcript_27835/g.50219  ORF Transcript_27835/g.50219 Transcript_27835/m.50219 type:complete len:212 (-) Transcript_27835:264-899(-)
MLDCHATLLVALFAEIGHELHPEARYGRILMTHEAGDPREHLGPCLKKRYPQITGQDLLKQDQIVEQHKDVRRGGDHPADDVIQNPCGFTESETGFIAERCSVGEAVHDAHCQVCPSLVGLEGHEGVQLCNEVCGLVEPLVGHRALHQLHNHVVCLLRNSSVLIPQEVEHRGNVVTLKKSNDPTRYNPRQPQERIQYYPAQLYIWVMNARV